MDLVGTRAPTPDRATGKPAVTMPPPSAVLAKAAAENFSVAPLFVGSRLRRELNSLYGFARLVDDLGDEAGGDRLALLDWAEAELERAAIGTAQHPIFQGLTRTMRAHDLDLAPFRDLVEANRIDQRVTRYETFDDLVGYCRLSANPVGRLVLAVLGQSTPGRGEWSDDVCTGLQIVEHLQDVGEDAARGRIYLPGVDLAREGCDEDDLRSVSASPALRRVIAQQADRARALFGSAIPLAASMHGRARLLISGFAAGGEAVVDGLETARYDVLAHPVRPRKANVVKHTWRIMRSGRS